MVKKKINIKIQSQKNELNVVSILESRNLKRKTFRKENDRKKNLHKNEFKSIFFHIF